MFETSSANSIHESFLNLSGSGFDDIENNISGSTTSSFPELVIPTGIQPITDNSTARKKELEDQLEELFRQAEFIDEFGDPNEDNPDLLDGLPDDFVHAQDPEEITQYFNNLPFESDYFPYPNKLMMMLDILNNLPRLRISGNLFRMILWLLHEAGVPNVPSYDAFHKLQTTLRKTCGSEPTQCTSSLGNIFYVNDIQESIARDFANPEVAKHLNFYPEEAEGPMSEVWQFARWKEFKPAELTPMYARGLRQFYIEEVSELESGEYVIPHDWVIRKGELTARCSLVQTLPHGWKIIDDMRIIPASQFKYNFDDIISRRGAAINWAGIIQFPPLLYMCPCLQCFFRWNKCTGNAKCPSKSCRWQRLICGHGSIVV